MVKKFKLFENDEINSKSKYIDVVLIPSGEILSVYKKKLFTLFEYEPEFEVNWSDEIEKFTLKEELKDIS